MSEYVVVYMPKLDIWKRGYLLAIVPARDIFRIKWTKHGKHHNQKGIWRVHPASLFSAEQFLPVPLEYATLAVVQNNRPREGNMATRGSSKAKPKASAKAKPKAKQVAEAPARTRVDKLGGLSEPKKRNIAKLIFRERSKSPATSWPDIIEMVQDKYDWTLPGSMTGRRLLRDYGPDGAEEAIIKQAREASGNGASTKKSAKKAASKKSRAKVVEEEELEDEELEDEEELEEELEEEEYDEEDEDEEDEEEEEEEPQPRKRVRVSRARGKKS